MRLIIAGGRDYAVTPEDFMRLDEIRMELGVDEVVSGGANGADNGGEVWAQLWHLPIKRFPADWGKHGRAAGPIRNAEMAAYADAVVLFPGGRGTDSMAAEARKAGIRIFDWRR